MPNPLLEPPPADPLWRRFRELHPDVTLVLLPDVPPAVPARVMDGDAALTEVAEIDGLAVALAGDFDLRGSPDGRWNAVGRGVVQRSSAVRGPAADAAAAEPRTIAFELSCRGWDAAVRDAKDLTWVEARRGERSLRFTVVDGVAELTVLGAHVGVSSELESALLRGRDV